MDKISRIWPSSLVCVDTNRYSEVNEKIIKTQWDDKRNKDDFWDDNGTKRNILKSFGTIKKIPAIFPMNLYTSLR